MLNHILKSISSLTNGKAYWDQKSAWLNPTYLIFKIYKGTSSGAHECSTMVYMYMNNTVYRIKVDNHPSTVAYQTLSVKAERQFVIIANRITFGDH